MRNKILVGLLSAGIIATGGAGTAAYASSHKDVTLALDGSDRTVSTFSGTVGELLQSQHVTVGEHDVVAPGPRTSSRTASASSCASAASSA